MIIRRDTSNRRERIVALLREQGSVQIPTLAERVPRLHADVCARI